MKQMLFFWIINNISSCQGFLKVHYLVNWVALTLPSLVWMLVDLQLEDQEVVMEQLNVTKFNTIR